VTGSTSSEMTLSVSQSILLVYIFSPVNQLW
jgi:hypothetical protein